jgi:hypothetical protein
MSTEALATGKVLRIDLTGDRGPSPQRRVGGVREGDPQASRVDAVAPRRVHGGESRSRKILRPREMPGVRRTVREPRRRQQPRHVVAHAARRRERRQIRRPLHPLLSRGGPADRRQRKRGQDQDEPGAEKGR